MKIRVAAVALAILLAAGFLLSIVLRPGSSETPAVIVNFVGFTNDAAGTRLARFSISNASPWAVARQGRYQTQRPVGSHWTEVHRDWFPGSTLAPASAEVLTLTAPTNQNEWRSVFFVSKDDGILRSMTAELLNEARKRGLPTPSERMERVAYPAYSDLIAESP